jgi:TRAP-type mannitol/chloroaromatic compound transport system substrate-binding protein
MSWKAQDRYSNDLIALQKEHGVKVHRTPNSIMDAQLKAWDKVLPQFMKDPFFAKVVESQKAWMKRVGSFELTNAPDYEGAYKHYFGSPV